MDLKQNIKKACFVFTVLSLACDSGDSNIENSSNQTIEIRKTLTLGFLVIPKVWMPMLPTKPIPPMTFGS